MRSLARRQAKGIARNPRAPESILVRLIAADRDVRMFALTRSDLPDAAYDLLVEHPDQWVRSALAESWYAPPHQRARLARDPDRRVRLTLAAGPTPFRLAVEPLPQEAYAILAADPDPEVRGELAHARGLPEPVRRMLLADSDPGVRRAAFWAWRDELPSDVLDACLSDEDPHMRGLARLAHPERAGAELAADPTAGGMWRSDLVEAVALTGPQAEMLAEEGTQIRAAVAANPTTPRELADRLAHDTEHEVRLAVSMRPDLTEAERAAIDYHVDAEDRLRPPLWIRRDHSDLVAMARCVASAHIGLRRGAACSPHLTAEMVATLAADTDFAVRLLLCENHPGAPADLLLRTFLEARVITRWDLLNRPNFPRVGLARLAASPHTEERRLALLDPEIATATVDRLSRDLDGHVRSAAAAHPALPISRALELLAQEPTGQSAAAHPEIPPALMHQILDDAGVPA